MSMGEIHLDPQSGEFFMQTPSGARRITLRCRNDGTVMVEEVAGGGMTIQPVKVTITPTSVAETHEIARALRAQSSRSQPPTTEVK